MDAATVYENIRALSAEFATERRERQQRRELVAADFARLREAGFLSSDRRAAGPWRHLGKRRRGHPADLRDAPHAHGDSSAALVCAMHPVVLSFWMAIPRAPAPFDNAWEGQRRSIFRNVCEGAWWGTIASEPDTSGDIAKTRATARRGPTDGAYLLTGQKNFGSGSGHLLHGHRGRSRRGDRPGHVRAGYAGRALGRLGRGDPDGCMGGARYARRIGEALGGFTQSLFTAVHVGVVEVALETARQQLSRRRDSLRAYERVEWTKAELEGWLIQQAYEGMLRAMEQDRDRRLRAVQAKTAIAELAESVLRRIGRVIGGGTFSRSSPFGYWYEDVRALGFLHPPLGLAYDQLSEWDAPN